MVGDWDFPPTSSFFFFFALSSRGSRWRTLSLVQACGKLSASGVIGEASLSFLPSTAFPGIALMDYNDINFFSWKGIGGEARRPREEEQTSFCHSLWECKGWAGVCETEEGWVVQAEEMIREKEQLTWAPSQPISTCLSKCLSGATLSKVADLDFTEFLSLPQFPHLQNEANVNVYLAGLLWGFNWLTFVKCLKRALMNFKGP